MKDEIKEKQLKEVLYGLDYIGNKIKNDDGKLELGVNNCKLLYDYIINLQEEKDSIDDYARHLHNENKRLQEKVNQYENPDDMTLFYMWLDEKTKDKMKQLQEENEYSNYCNEELRKKITNLEYKIKLLEGDDND